MAKEAAKKDDLARKEAEKVAKVEEAKREAKEEAEKAAAV